jgi:hypothetical protein
MEEREGTLKLLTTHHSPENGFRQTNVTSLNREFNQTPMRTKQ